MNNPGQIHTEMLSHDRISQQDLGVLLDHAPDAIARFDRTLRHVYVNDATGKANNRPASDFFGKTMEDLGHTKEVCEVINGKLREVFDRGEELTCELLFQGPHGPTWYQCRMAPEFDPSGAVEYALVVSRDISEQKNAEAMIRDVERNAAKNELAAMLAHEINNPLSAAVYSVHLLQNNQSLNAEGREMVQVAAENLERVTEISKRLLTLYGSEEEPDRVNSKMQDGQAHG